MINRTNTAFYTGDAVDKLLIPLTGVTTGLATNTSLQVALPLPVNDTLLHQGIWSIDGTNWQDISDANYTAAGVVNAQISAWCIPGTFYLECFNVRNVATVPFSYKIVGIAKDNQGIFPVQPFGIATAYDSRQNVEKMAVSSILPATIAASATFTQTIPHNLGFVPPARCFLEMLTTSVFSPYGGGANVSIIDCSNSLAAGALHMACTITIDSTNLYLSIKNNNAGSVSVNIHYRIYYDK